MQVRLGEAFNTVRTEGSILPPDLLRRIPDGDKSLNGLGSSDYGLSDRETIGEAVNRAWNRLIGAWWRFQSALQKVPSADPATSLTREQWLLPLFEDLGFGRLNPTRAIEVDGKAYAVSHIWQNTPLHLVGFHIDLDKRTAGVAGAARSSPHSLVQELINRSSGYLWGIVSNGRYLRILRDNISLTRQAFVEFDLEAMMAGEVYSDFMLFWLLAHSSRFAAKPPEQCWLELWSQAANAQGARALDQLRAGVESAILALGRGFISNKHNDRLVDDLESARLSAQDYYRQLLRVVYRLIFLFVAEDRDLLFDPGASDAARDRYIRYYSVGRLRRLATHGGGGKHIDLFRGLSLLARQLGSDAGCAGLGLPGLGSFLWSPEATAALNECDLANHDLLEAVSALAYTSTGKVRRSVDYKNLGSEELGSVYESLLELHPLVDMDTRSFELATAGGHERKTTGSYYTPTTLINSLLDSVLDPIVDKAASRVDPETAMLDLKILDPACGSGHFLIAAAHRLAKRLATIRTGDQEPSPSATRSALRDVIGRCLFGVDVNEMAVELCKVSLWMEAIDPGKPLSFLDHHIVCGNSLLGTTPALLAHGIPDAAFAPIEGDDKAVVATLKKQNRKELQGQLVLAATLGLAELQRPMSKGLDDIEELADTSSISVREKASLYTGLVQSPGARHAKVAADAWCAAFFARKDREAPTKVTQAVLQQIAADPSRLSETTANEIQRLAEIYRFFHWHIAFPDVFRIPSDKTPANPETGWSGGFDVVLSNPPWDQIQLDAREFFASTHAEIAEKPNTHARNQAIMRLASSDPSDYAHYVEETRRLEGIQLFVHASGRYPLTGFGRLNSAPLFAELSRTLLSPTGRAGLIVPTGIATDSFTQHFFRQLVETESLVSLYDFENSARIFPSVHRSYRFCLMTLAGRSLAVGGAQFIFFAQTTADLTDEKRRFTLTAEDLALVNPNSRTCPVFRSKRDAELTKAIYQRVPVLSKDGPPRVSPWGFKGSLMFMMNTSSGIFRTKGQLQAEGWSLDGNVYRRSTEAYLPLYEGKMIDIYDHRAANVVQSETATVRQGQPKALTVADHESPFCFPQPRYWVPTVEVEARLADWPRAGWLSCLADVTSVTNERTVIAALIPCVGVGNSAPLLRTSEHYRRVEPLLIANFSSFILDFLARSKVGGIHLNYFIVEQFPILAPTVYDAKAPWSSAMSLSEWMMLRIVELCYTAWDLAPLVDETGFSGPPFRWDERRRCVLLAELDAAFFHLYGVSRDDVEYIMESFPIVKRRDEATYGEYRTKLLVLDRYDAMRQASTSTKSYRTPLDPPPADPRMRHPARRSRLKAAAT